MTYADVAVADVKWSLDVENTARGGLSLVSWCRDTRDSTTDFYDVYVLNLADRGKAHDMMYEAALPWRLNSAICSPR